MRIWVTGVGMISPLARGAEPTMDALLAGRRAFGPVTLFDTAGCRSSIAAEVGDLDLAELAPRGETVGWSRTDGLAVIAAREALAHARLDAAEPVDLIIGGTTAGMYETEELLAQMHRDPAARQPLERMLSHPLSATADRLREVVAPFRRVQTLCSACSSGTNAVLLAASWLRTGRSQRVLAGGADGLCRLTYCGFSCLGALSPAPCRPFDVARQGLNLGEAAAFLVLETEAAARERGAQPIVELRGWAVAAEAHHITHPLATGEMAALVMERAIERAELPAAEIGYVNAHGTATPLNDKMESAALRRCFGKGLDGVAVSSSKGQLGHTLGAAGAVEAVITSLALQRNMLPPTAGLETVDPDCQLNHVPEARPAALRAAMSNSFGFGGSDAVLVLAQPGLYPKPTVAPERRVVISAAASYGVRGMLGTVASGGYLQPGPAPVPAPLPFEAKEHLDLARARRVDRAGRMAAATMGQALSDAELGADEDARHGAILGAAFGGVDDCSAFVNRIYEKGARFASPAVFPSLLPSSPVAHASIYHRLRGAVFATADLGATTEGAMVASSDLIAAGEADAMLAGGVEVGSSITEAVLGPLLSTEAAGATERSEGSAVVVLEALETLRGRGGRALAEIAWSNSWRGDAAEAQVALLGLPAAADATRAKVFGARADAATRALLAGSTWAELELASTAPQVGNHEAAGGFAATAAVSLLAAGTLDEALIVGIAADRGHVLLLRRWQVEPATTEAASSATEPQGGE